MSIVMELTENRDGIHTVDGCAHRCVPWTSTLLSACSFTTDTRLTPA